MTGIDPPSGAPTPSSIRLLNWGRYLSAETLAGFEERTGIRVGETTINSNEEFIRRVSAGERFDVIVPEDWAAEVLIDAGLLQPLDMELLPNWEHVTQPYFQAPPYDPGTDGVKYTSIFCFGTEGFAVRLDRIALPPKSWRMLYDPAYAGQIAMLDGSREVLGPALFLLGADPNCTDAALLDQAAAMATAQKPLVTRYDTQGAAQSILDGTPIVECWDGDVAAAITQGAPGIRYVLPNEGYRVWADAPCIPGERPASGGRPPFPELPARAPCRGRRTPTTRATSPSCRRPTRWCAVSCSAPCGPPTSRWKPVRSCATSAPSTRPTNRPTPAVRRA